MFGIYNPGSGGYVAHAIYSYRSSNIFPLILQTLICGGQFLNIHITKITHCAKDL